MVNIKIRLHLPSIDVIIYKPKHKHVKKNLESPRIMYLYSSLRMTRTSFFKGGEECSSAFLTFIYLFDECVNSANEVKTPFILSS
jgi:hypothetical protein